MEKVVAMPLDLLAFNFLIAAAMADDNTKHASADIRVVKCADGLHYSFEMLEYIHSELYDSCAAIKTDKSLLVRALWRCWSFVDLVHRIREISQALPGLTKKNAELVEFLNRTKVAEDFRHYIQHLRSELSKPGVNKSPVWGSLAWVDKENPTFTHTILLGARLEGVSYGSCVFDTHNRRWVSRVCLASQNRSFNFDPIFEACVKFRKFIMPWVESTYKAGFQIASDPPIVSMQLVAGGDIWTRAKADKPL